MKENYYLKYELLLGTYGLSLLATIVILTISRDDTEILVYNHLDEQDQKTTFMVAGDDSQFIDASRILFQPDLDPDEIYQMNAISPNGKQTAIVGNDERNEYVKLTIIDNQSGAEQVVYRGIILNAYIENLVWSPDGRYVAFQEWSINQRLNLIVIDAQSLELVTVKLLTSSGDTWWLTP